MSSSRAIKRRKAREVGPKKHGQPLLIKDFFDPDNDDQVVRRWELVGILQWVESHERLRTSPWQRLKRWLKKAPPMMPAITMLNLQRLETARSRIRSIEVDEPRTASFDAEGRVIQLEP